jgi:rubrerythrin
MERKQRRIIGRQLFNGSPDRDAEIVARDINLEQSAIDEYTGQLETASPELRMIIYHLINEERDHKKMLEEFIYGMESK